MMLLMSTYNLSEAHPMSYVLLQKNYFDQATVSCSFSQDMHTTIEKIQCVLVDNLRIIFVSSQYLLESQALGHSYELLSLRVILLSIFYGKINKIIN